MTDLLVLSLFSIAASSPVVTDAAPVKIVFLPEDDLEACPGGGLTPCFICPLDTYTARTNPDIYTRFSFKKVMDAGLGPYYIYNKRYCRPIGKLLGANLFVMTNIVPTQSCTVDSYRVEIKAWSSVTDREAVIWRGTVIHAFESTSPFAGHERELLDKILEVTH